MIFFTDTNIPIGYTIIHDKWHEKSKKFYFQNEEDIFWSNLVQKEYNETLKDIVQSMDVFLKKSEYLLKNNSKDFINYEEFERYLIRQTQNCCLDNTKKRKILEEFWTKYDFSEGISTIVHLKFKEFIEDFEKIYFKRDLKLTKIMKLHDCGLDNYLRYRDYAQKLYDNGVHSPDCKIIVDAHDCGLTYGNLIFVSNDDKLIESVSKIDTSHLKIIEFRSYN